MMPVATPPNAILYGTGAVTIPQMAKAGLWMNLFFGVAAAGRLPPRGPDLHDAMIAITTRFP